MVYLFICVQVGGGAGVGEAGVGGVQMGWGRGWGTRSADFSPQQQCLNVNICTVNNNYFVQLFSFQLIFFNYFVNKWAKNRKKTSKQKTETPCIRNIFETVFFSSVLGKRSKDKSCFFFN